MTTDFAAKNERRRKERATKTGGKARAARKKYAMNGAFGSYGEGSLIWDLCTFGRSGVTSVRTEADGELA